MDIQFTARVFKEGRVFVAYAPGLDVSSCGGTPEKALKNCNEAVRLFLEEAEKLGTLDRILEEAGNTPASVDARQNLAPSHKAPGGSS